MILSQIMDFFNRNLDKQMFVCYNLRRKKGEEKCEFWELTPDMPYLATEFLT